MGNICSRLCPQRRKNNKTSYDVHEETFEMEENIESINIDDNSPTITKNANLTEQYDHYEQQATEGLINKTSEQKSKKQQKKYIETKINAHLKNSEISEETVSFNLVSQENLSQKVIQQPSSHIEIQQINSSPLILSKLSRAQDQQTQEKRVQTEAEKVEQKKPNPNILKPKAVKKKYNPDDYRFKDEANQFRVKKIDSIKCQQYNIQNCKDSQYFIFDITANVYIDDTDNCKIYIAPCESTIFVRNCKNLTIVAATKQFRTYQTHNCTFSLLCKSQPVIQSSSQLTFASFQINYYAEFAKQMNQVKLDLWNNHWSEIHNFTKKEGEIHYSLKRHLQSSLDWEQGFFEGEIQQFKEGRVPFIQGELPLEWDSYQKCIILFNKDVSKDDNKIMEMIENYRILKSFKGKIAGFGKDDRVALLLATNQDFNNREELEELGQVFSSQQEVEKYGSQFFLSFGDEREK